MGGCIVIYNYIYSSLIVSSLYGRVYRVADGTLTAKEGFLPVWEGVSELFYKLINDWLFPPCMGGCINNLHRLLRPSLTFPPCMGGCIVPLQFLLLLIRVSSLYGRVYRTVYAGSIFCAGFLPVWEGVSLKVSLRRQLLKFPPYMGGCIRRTKL